MFLASKLQVDSLEILKQNFQYCREALCLSEKTKTQILFYVYDNGYVHF